MPKWQKCGLILLLGSIILSAIFNLIGLWNIVPAASTIFWCVVLNALIAVYLFSIKPFYYKLIMSVQTIKSAALLVLTCIYGISLDGFLIMDAYRFSGTAGARYRTGENLIDTKYPVLCEKVYRVVGENPSVIILLNITLITIVLILFSRMLTMLDVDESGIRHASMLMVSFSPYMFYVSINYLREPTMYFSCIMSLYLFMKWMYQGRLISIVLMILSLFPGLYLHDGVMSFPIVYVAFFLFTWWPKDVKQMAVKIASIIVIIIVSYLFIKYVMWGNVLNMFGDVRSYTDIADALMGVLKYKLNYLNRIGGGSSYIMDMKLDSVSDLPRYLVQIVLYFLFSPAPWHWRDWRDVAVFFTDSIIAIIAIMGGIVVIIGPKSEINTLRKKSVSCILLIILSTALIYGCGTGTAGTALRHRAVLVPLYGLLIAVSGNVIRSKINRIETEED